MGLNAILKDRARTVSKQATGVKVNGRTTFTQVTGPWFKARLMLADSPEAEDTAGGRKRDVMTPTLVYGVKDTLGNPVVVTSEDLLEVTSNELPSGFYRVTGDPEPYRKKRRVIGHEAHLARVESHEVAA